jgi:histidinol-phosphate aminotransferase
MSYERPHLRNVEGYVPGRQPIQTNVIKLNTNENPYPPSPKVMEALVQVQAEQLRKYPPPLATPVREELAQLHNISVENTMIVNGGDELLRLAITTFVDPGVTIGLFEPSYSLYPVLAEVNNSPVVRIPLSDTWQVPAHAAQALNKAQAKLTFIVNPHAPSGTLLPITEIESLASQLNGVLLIDEAYIDFVDPQLSHNVVPLITKLPNVLILRTLSKGYGLAGLRLGYALGSEQLILPMLSKTRDSYNVDVVAQTLAKQALMDQAYAASTWENVRKERNKLYNNFKQLGLSCPESQSNFLLVTFPQGSAMARRVLSGLEQRGILVRYFDTQGLQDKLRITVGTAEQNQRLLNGIEEILRESLSIMRKDSVRA